MGKDLTLGHCGLLSFSPPEQGLTAVSTAPIYLPCSKYVCESINE